MTHIYIIIMKISITNAIIFSIFSIYFALILLLFLLVGIHTVRPSGAAMGLAIIIDRFLRRLPYLIIIVIIGYLFNIKVYDIDIKYFFGLLLIINMINLIGAYKCLLTRCEEGFLLINFI